MVLLLYRTKRGYYKSDLYETTEDCEPVFNYLAECPDVDCVFEFDADMLCDPQAPGLNEVTLDWR